MVPGDMTAEHALGAHVGKHDRVEALPQAALLDVGVGDVLELELVLFEQPPRPAFVDALDPRLVEADAGAADRPGVGRRAVARCGGAKPEIARDRFPRCRERPSLRVTRIEPAG